MFGEALRPPEIEPPVWVTEDLQPIPRNIYGVTKAAGFTLFTFPATHRRRLRTTNLVERLNEEIRRRTRVARLFPNEASCLRLVTAPD